MKFITFINDQGEQKAGWVEESGVYDMEQISKGDLPANMLDFIQNHVEYSALLSSLSNEIKPTHSIDDIQLVAPLPNPPSVRDFMAFEKHIVNATKQSGLNLAQEWYEIPAFYFTNHLALSGHEQIIQRPPNCKALDYELEIACVIGKEGINIKSEEAEDYIFGYTIFNDWSARDLQMKEMKVGLGPAKGKDFATSIGPYIVTKDEFRKYKTGNNFDVTMTATVNGKQLSEGNHKDVYYSFGQMIEHASTGVRLYPGDIIGSGTVGTGCILELGKDTHRWLEPGDLVDLEITGLGKLTNKIN